MTNYLETALWYFIPEKVHLIPVDKDKRPMCQWKKYQVLQTREDIKQIFSKPSWGIAMLTGVGDIECIDIDSKHYKDGILHSEYLTEVNKITDHSIQIVFQSTVSKGRHIVYRCNTIEGNLKLAKVDGNTILETRGVGGYIVVAPTPGYEWISGGPDNIPYISEDDRSLLLEAARGFNRDVATLPAPKVTITTGDKLPADDYNEKHNWQDMQSMLESHGWQAIKEDSKRVYMRRPGKSNGSHSGDILKDRCLFKNWSSNSLNGEEATYSMFGLYAMLNHMGDYSEAAKDLYQQGYGERAYPDLVQNLIDYYEHSDKESVLPVINEEEKKSQAVEITLDGEDDDLKFTWHYKTRGGRMIPIAGPGSIIVITGDTGAGKSTIQDLMCACALSGKPFNGLSIDLEGNKMLRIDTEQEKFWLKKSMRRIFQMVNHFGINHKHLEYIALGDVHKISDKVEEVVSRVGDDIAALMIDNIVDLIGKVNDEEASLEFVNYWKHLGAKHGFVTVVTLHETRSSGLAQGWLGKILEQRSAWTIRMKAETTSDGIEVFTAQNRKKRGEPFTPIQFTRGPGGTIVPYEPTTSNYGAI